MKLEMNSHCAPFDRLFCQASKMEISSFSQFILQRLLLPRAEINCWILIQRGGKNRKLAHDSISHHNSASSSRHMHMHETPRACNSSLCLSTCRMCIWLYKYSLFIKFTAKTLDSEFLFPARCSLTNRTQFATELRDKLNRSPNWPVAGATWAWQIANDR